MKLDILKIKMYYVYILKCADKTLYTGITTDLKRRIAEHNSSKLGAKYTSSRRPVTLVYSKKFKTMQGGRLYNLYTDTDSSEGQHRRCNTDEGQCWWEWI